MADTFLEYSDSIRYVLQSEVSNSLLLTKEPDGFMNDDLEISRDKKWHGVFNQITNSLTFYGDAKDYIRLAFEIKGHNANLYLIKYTLQKDVKGTAAYGTNDIKWGIEYMGLADWDTLEESNYGLKIKFQSDALKKTLDSHNGDTFELERDDDIDGNAIDDLYIDKVSIQGRSIVTKGEQKLNDNNDSPIYKGVKNCVIPTQYISEGAERFVTIDGETNAEVEISNDYSGMSASNLFYVNDTDTQALDTDVHVEIDMSVKIILAGGSTVKLKLSQVKWDGAKYVLVREYELADLSDGSTKNVKANIDFTYENSERQLEWNDGLVLWLDRVTFSFDQMEVFCFKENIIVTEKPFFEPSINLDFIFLNSALGRLLQIITGKKKKFYSKMFGRNDDDAEQRGEYTYAETSRYGEIGLISGLWARAFDRDSERYKSIKLSLGKTLDSLRAVFNIGVSIETVGNEERLRVEDLKYYYQNETVVKLPLQVSNIKRKIDSKLYFSGVEVGYDKGGDYENEIGLDEPNTRTEFVTPLRKTKNKLNKISSIRSDEYGMEILRRKPQAYYPEEDINGDEDNWFLDVKRTPVSTGSTRTQRDWDDDRLVVPPTGILEPLSYRAFLFTPKRMLLRHGWILRAGMEQKTHVTDESRSKIKYISSKNNTNLAMQFEGVDGLPNEELIVESDDVRVGDLERARFLPEIITFEHPIDDDLMAQILDTTTKEYQGSNEEIPNVYFKFEWVNEEGNTERGYLLSLKPNKAGVFTMQKANENLY